MGFPTSNASAPNATGTPSLQLACAYFDAVFERWSELVGVVNHASTTLILKSIPGITSRSTVGSCSCALVWMPLREPCDRRVVMHKSC